MTNKTEKCYEHVFRYVNENVFELNCATFTTDYEVAMRNAIHKLFPNANQIACYFHFTQAVKKNAWKTTGMVDLIRSNPAARSVYYRLQCIPLLPPLHIVNMFALLKAEAYKIERTVFHPFLKYYHQQLIVKVVSFSLLSLIFSGVAYFEIKTFDCFVSSQEGPENISVYGQSMRTTSSLEANNGTLNDNVVNHGNLFTFIHDLRLEEFLQWQKFKRHFESGGQAAEPRPKYKVQ